MPSINTTIKIHDQMTRQFAVMNNAVSTMIDSFSKLDDTMSQDFKTAALENMRRELESIAGDSNKAIEEITRAEEQQQRFNQRIQGGSSAAESLLRHFKAIAATIGAGLGVKKLMEASDAMVSNRARLDLINDGLQTTDDLMNMSYDAAMRSRGAYQAMTASIGQLGMNARSAFASSAEIVGFSELLSKQLAIAGANAQATESVMYNLTQALSTGVLRGQDLNAVLSNAPNIVQAIADYMGVSMGQLREMAQAGEISAEVVKAAMFAAADDINDKFKSMPMTFGQMWQQMSNFALKALEPVLSRMNELLNSPAFAQFAAHAQNAITKVGRALMQILEIIVAVTNFIADNWSWIAPLVMGIVGALIGWEVASFAVEAATFAVAAANAVLNAVLNANPLMWIFLLIGLVTMAIWSWVESVGGLTNAWLIAKDVILTAVGQIALWSAAKAFESIEAWERFKIGIYRVAAGVANGLDQMRATGLMIIESFVNGAIDLINKLIAAVNSILPNTLTAIEHVTFGTEAKIQAEANAKMRANTLAQKQAGLEKMQASHQRQLDAFAKQMNSEHQARLGEIRARQGSRGQGGGFGGVGGAGAGAFDFSGFGGNMGDALGGINDHTGSTAGHTGKMADAMDAVEGDLGLLRELAEMEVTNTFTTAEVHVDMTNHNTIAASQDIDGIVTTLSDSLKEELGLVAEGAHY